MATSAAIWEPIASRIETAIDTL
jgi:hypothetical protein